MVISKSTGVTPTEELLAKLCDKTFLKLWSYPNPHCDDGKELCDLLVVFENDVLIFFDRENRAFEANPQDIALAWKRWRNKAIDKQVSTAHKAERYIRSGRSIFLDSKKTQPFPLPIDTGNVRFHKIVVAHGVREACKSSSPANVSGSLAISYEPSDVPRVDQPFLLELDRDNPIHVLDTENLEIALNELDTIFDFTAYLDAKIEAIRRHQMFSYCGEEDVIAHYFLNYDKTKKRHMIGTFDDFDSVHIGEGEWADFEKGGPYERRKKANETSYFWDRLLQITSDNALKGTLLGNSQPFEGKSALHFMAKEPRFVRRELSDHMLKSIRNFPESDEPLVRNVSLMPSFYSGTCYVFLQLKALGLANSFDEHREARTAILEIACGAVKLKRPDIERVIGIAIDAPKFAGQSNSEDMILMEFNEWNDERRAYYEEANKEWRFFTTPQMQITKKRISEFPPVSTKKAQVPKRAKVGRNDLCLCGSGKKSKRCCNR
jgi:SEC-C motif